MSKPTKKVMKKWRNSEKGKATLKKINHKYSISERGRFVTRNRHLLWNFGITVEQYNEMLADQLWGCAICGKSEIRKLRGKVLPLAVDHNKVTGKTRALLCDKCNKGIGFFDENQFRLFRAVKYLAYWKKEGEKV